MSEKQKIVDQEDLWSTCQRQFQAWTELLQEAMLGNQLNGDTEIPHEIWKQCREELWGWTEILESGDDVNDHIREEIEEFREKIEIAPERIEDFREVEVGPTESEVVYKENKLELLHYKSDTEQKHKTPILLVYALINRPYILDLQPGKSVVKRLLENGFDVYMIDWGRPSYLDSSLSLYDYVDRYIDNCVDVVRERADVEDINILGYCMGGTMSTMYSTLHPDKVRNLGLMASGLYFDGAGGLLETWGDEEHYNPRNIKEISGNVPGEFLDVGFALMNPVENLFTKYLHLYDNLENEEFVKNFARMERWIWEEVDVAGEAYTEFLEKMYQQNQLYKNELQLNGKNIDINNIDMPVLQIIAEYDHLVPPESSKKFNEVLNTETETYEFPTGHVGLSVSSRSHKDLWPRVAEWFAEKSEPIEKQQEQQTQKPQKEKQQKEQEEQQKEKVKQQKEEGKTGRDIIEMKGIGETYASRLYSEGIETIEDLADADIEKVSNTAEVSDERARSWIELAKEEIKE